MKNPTTLILTALTIFTLNCAPKTSVTDSATLEITETKTTSALKLNLPQIANETIGKTRTIIPDMDLNIHSYKISGTSAKGKTFERQTTESQILIENLIADIQPYYGLP